MREGRSGCQGLFLKIKASQTPLQVQALAVIFALFCFTWMIGFGLFFAFNSAFGFLVSSNTLQWNKQQLGNLVYWPHFNLCDPRTHSLPAINRESNRRRTLLLLLSLSCPQSPGKPVINADLPLELGSLVTTRRGRDWKSSHTWDQVLIPPLTSYVTQQFHLSVPWGSCLLQQG